MEDLFILTEQLLDIKKVKLKEIGSVICSRGPASFTGIRKNLTVASALSFNSTTKILTVSELAAQSYVAFLLKNPNIILIANDAKKEQIFFAAYQFKKRNLANCLQEDSIVKPEHTMPSIVIDDQNLCLVGDGWHKYHKRIPENLKNFPSIEINDVRPSTLISLALSHPSLLTLMHQDIQPNYLRHPVE